MLRFQYIGGGNEADSGPNIESNSDVSDAVKRMRCFDEKTSLASPYIALFVRMMSVWKCGLIVRLVSAVVFFFSSSLLLGFSKPSGARTKDKNVEDTIVIQVVDGECLGSLALVVTDIV